MMALAALLVAIASEVSGTVALRLASSSPRWYFLTVSAYVVAFAALARALDDGMSLGVAYAIWAAASVALTTSLARILFGEVLTRVTYLGLALVVIGVVLVETSVA